MSVSIPIRTAAIVATVGRAPPSQIEPSPSPFSTSAIATSADEMPPNPLSAATSSGIWVVGVFLANSSPMPPPATTPAAIVTQLMSSR